MYVYILCLLLSCTCHWFLLELKKYKDRGFINTFQINYLQNTIINTVICVKTSQWHSLKIMLIYKKSLGNSKGSFLVTMPRTWWTQRQSSAPHRTDNAWVTVKRSSKCIVSFIASVQITSLRRAAGSQTAAVCWRPYVLILVYVFVNTVIRRLVQLALGSVSCNTATSVLRDFVHLLTA